MSKKENLSDQYWLKEAEKYAESKGVTYLDFSDKIFWLDYKNNYQLSPSEAVDEYLCDQ